MIAAAIGYILWALVFETSASIDVAIKTGGVLGGFSTFCSAKNTLKFQWSAEVDCLCVALRRSNKQQITSFPAATFLIAQLKQESSTHVKHKISRAYAQHPARYQ
jgi:hypothetical protein